MQVESPSKCVRWQLLRVRPGNDVLVELLSGEWLLLVTHFAGRSILCAEVAECELCDLLPGRAFWYLPALVLPQRRPCILELSAQASTDLEQVAKFSAGSVGAGIRLTLSRRGPKSPIRSAFEDFVASPTRTNVDEWGSLLMAVFGFAPLRPLENLDAYGERIRPQVLARAAAAAARVRAGQKK